MKMIIKGRSPIMRNTSRSLRVSCSWLVLTELIRTPRFKSSLSTPNTNLQTYWQRGISQVMNGTIFFICLTSAISAAALRISAWPAAPEPHWNDGEKDEWCKKRKEKKGSRKVKPTMNLAVSVSTSSSTVQNPIASKSPGILKAPCHKDWLSTGKLDWREPNRDAASSSQRWHKDAVLDAGTRKLVASGNSETEDSDKIWPHNLHTSTDYVPHMEKVFSILRQWYGLGPRDEMKNFNMNTAVWCIFMSVTLQAAVHHGKDYTENLRSTKNQPLKS